jgi:hypothetical protein
VVARAHEVLGTLSVPRNGPIAKATGALPSEPGYRAAAAAPTNGQLGLFTEFIAHPAVSALQELKLDAMTPMQAFDALRALHAMVEAR